MQLTFSQYAVNILNIQLNLVLVTSGFEFLIALVSIVLGNQYIRWIISLGLCVEFFPIKYRKSGFSTILITQTMTADQKHDFCLLYSSKQENLPNCQNGFIVIHNGLFIHTTLPINNITPGINLSCDIQGTCCTYRACMQVHTNSIIILLLAQSLSQSENPPVPIIICVESHHIKYSLGSCCFQYFT